MKRIALLGMPNTGKSTFFNRLTGASARVGNWPGVTVDLLSAKILAGDTIAEVVDLPGIYDLRGFSDDEEVVRDFLRNNPVDVALIILNAVQIDRQLRLALQLRQLGLPCVLLLNMQDEADKLGIAIDQSLLADKLGMPVVSLSAKYGHGFERIRPLLALQLKDSTPAAPTHVAELLARQGNVDREADEIVRDAVSMPLRLPEGWTPKLDHLLLHPWLGLPLFFGIMFLVFQAVFWLGAPLQDAVEWLLDTARSAVLEPALRDAPAFVHGLLLDGIYNGVGTVASFVPIIVLFFLFMALVEDTGYLSRAAFLMDSLMSRMGLDGRSFVMLLMGFGCNVPALMGTRIMRSRPLRLLTMLVIPFSLCSARLQVFVFITAALFTAQAAPYVLFSLYLFSFATAFLTALLFKRRFASHEPFLLEMPPYRLPTFRHMALRGWHEVRHFLRRASKFIVAGVVLVWILTNYPGDNGSGNTFASMIGDALNPVLAPIGIDHSLTLALIFGFVAKEVVIGALAVIYGAEGVGLSNLMATQLDWVQAYSFMLFALVYTPCLSTIATMKSESRSARMTLLSVAWPLFLAWVLSFGFYQTARALGY